MVLQKLGAARKNCRVATFLQLARPWPQAGRQLSRRSEGLVDCCDG